MSDVFGVQHQVDFFVHRHNQLARGDVVTGGDIIFRIEAEEIDLASALADFAPEISEGRHRTKERERG